MNRTLYYEDSYLRFCDCTVLSVAECGKYCHVVTDQTVFYPECGGQPGDRGTLGPYRVVDTRKADDGSSVLVVEGKPEAGSVMRLTLDWEHRYFYMVMHTAQHLLSGLLYSLLGIGTVAVHQGEEYLTIEVDKDEVPSSSIDALVCAANKAVEEGHNVFYRCMSHADAQALGMRRSIKVDGDVRIVEIEDLDRIACGGVHVSSTSELRLVTFAGQEMIRGHVRLSFKCGSLAVSSALADRDIVSSLCRHFSCSSSELVAKVLKTESEKNACSASLAHLSVVVARSVIASQVSGGVAAFETSLDLAAFVEASNDYDDLAMLALHPAGERTEWLIVSKGALALPFASLREIVGGKGGGKMPVYRGVMAPESEAVAVKAFKGLFA